MIIKQKASRGKFQLSRLFSETNRACRKRLEPTTSHWTGTEGDGEEDRDAEEDKERRAREREMESYNTGVELLSSLFSLKAYDSHAACSTAVCSVPPVRDQLFLVTLLPNLTRGR